MLEIVAKFCCVVDIAHRSPLTVKLAWRDQATSRNMCGSEILIERKSDYCPEYVDPKRSPRPRPIPNVKHQSTRARIPYKPLLRPLSVGSSTTAAQSISDNCLMDAKIVTCEPQRSTVEGSAQSIPSVKPMKRGSGTKERYDVWIVGFETGRRDEVRKEEQVRKWTEKEKQRLHQRRKHLEQFKEEERAQTALAEAERRRHEEELARMKKRQREQQLAQAVEAHKLRAALEIEEKRQEAERRLEEARGSWERDILVRRRDPTDRRSFRQRVDGALRDERTSIRRRSRRQRRSDSVSSASSHSVEEIVRRVRKAMSILSFSERERDRWSKRRRRGAIP